MGRRVEGARGSAGGPNAHPHTLVWAGELYVNDRHKRVVLGSGKRCRQECGGQGAFE